MNRSMIKFISLCAIVIALFSATNIGGQSSINLPFVNSQAFTTLAGADIYAAAHNQTLWPTKNYISTTGTMTFTSNVDMGGGGTLTCAGGKYHFTKTFNAQDKQVFIGCVAGDVTFGSGSVKEVCPEWWGAVANNNPASATTNNLAITSAIESNQKVVFAKGTYYVTGIKIYTESQGANLVGAGMRKTVIRCADPNANVFEIHDSSKGGVPGYFIFFKMSEMSIMGAGKTSGGTGNGIYCNGLVWYTFTNLHISENPKNGLNLTNDYVVGDSSGSYVGTVQGCMFISNGEVGLKQVATAGTNQQNASYIVYNEMQANSIGVQVWGANIVVRENVIEGNSDLGLLIDNGITTPPIYSASQIIIQNNYFELNTNYHIKVKTNSTVSGVILNLNISNNFGLMATDTPAIFFDCTGENSIRRLIYEQNSFNLGGGGLTQEIYAPGSAKYGNSPLNIVKPLVPNTISIYSSVAQLTAFETGLYNSMDRVILPLNVTTMHGMATGVSGSGLSYTAMDKSSNVTVSGSSILFPLNIPWRATIQKISIPVLTDSTDWSISMNLWTRDGFSASLPGYAIRIYFTGPLNQSGSQLVESSSAPYHVSAPAVQLNNIDSYIKITVTLTTPGTFFYLGNLSVIHN